MQRGFTIAELIVATGVVALLAAGGALALGGHPMSSSSAFIQLRAQLEAARALASASGDGATVVITSAGSGFRSQVFSGRPDGMLPVSQIAPVISQAALNETSLGAAPFTIVVSEAGDFSVAAGPLGAGAACPSAGEVRLEVSEPSGGRHTLALPCKQSAIGSPEPVVTNSPVP